MSEIKKPTIEEIVRCKDLSYLYATLEITEEQHKEFMFLERKIMPFDRIGIMYDAIKKRDVAIACLVDSLETIFTFSTMNSEYKSFYEVAKQAIAKAKRDLGE